MFRPASFFVWCSLQCTKYHLHVPVLYKMRLAILQIYESETMWITNCQNTSKWIIKEQKENPYIRIQLFRNESRIFLQEFSRKSTKAHTHQRTQRNKTVTTAIQSFNYVTEPVEPKESIVRRPWLHVRGRTSHRQNYSVHHTDTHSVSRRHTQIRSWSTHRLPARQLQRQQQHKHQST